MIYTRPGGESAASFCRTSVRPQRRCLVSNDPAHELEPPHAGTPTSAGVSAYPAPLHPTHIRHQRHQCQHSHSHQHWYSTPPPPADSSRGTGRPTHLRGAARRVRGPLRVELHVVLLDERVDAGVQEGIGLVGPEPARDRCAW